MQKISSYIANVNFVKVFKCLIIYNNFLHILFLYTHAPAEIPQQPIVSIMNRTDITVRLQFERQQNVKWDLHYHRIKMIDGDGIVTNALDIVTTTDVTIPITSRVERISIETISRCGHKSTRRILNITGNNIYIAYRTTGLHV